MQTLRYLFAGLAVLFVVGVLIQVFLAGMAVFGAGAWATHIDLGYGVAMAPLLLILAAWVAKAGRSTILLSVAALAVAQVQTFLPWFRDDVPWVAALHPVNAMVVFGLAVVLARRAVALARGGETIRTAEPEPVAQRA